MIKEKFKHSILARVLLNIRRIVRQKILIKFNDYNFICFEYKRRLKRELNLANPKRYTEQLQWHKLFYRNDLMPICVDKIEAKKYLKELGYEKYLVPTLFTFDSVKEIQWE